MRLFVCMLLFYVCINSISQEVGIQFSADTTLTAMLAKAKENNKLVFIDCYTVWCGPCRDLAMNTFTKKEVGDYFNQHFVSYKVDMEKPYAIDIKKKYDVNSYPTLLFIDSTGDLMQKTIGSKTPAELINEGQKVSDSLNNYSTTVKRIKEGDRSFEAISDYLQTDPSDSIRDVLINDYFNALPQDQKWDKNAFTLFNDYVDDINNPLAEHFIQNRSYYEKHYRKTVVETKIVNLIFKSFRQNPSDTININRLRAIHEKFVQNLEANWAFHIASEKIKNEAPDAAYWNYFVKTAPSWIETLNHGSYLLNELSYIVYKNYKQYNDLSALQKAESWSRESIKKDSKRHEFYDTYAHILFDLGNVKGAIKNQTKAVKYASKENSDLLSSYSNELENFNKIML